jgi:uncharacterized protein (DUF2344 family)
MKTIEQKGYLFQVLSEIDKTLVKDYEQIKNKLRADMVLWNKDKTKYIFIRYIPDAEIIEETNNV